MYYQPRILESFNLRYHFLWRLSRCLGLKWEKVCSGKSTTLHSQTNIMKTHNLAKLSLKSRVTFLWTDKQLTQSCLLETKSIFNSGTALLYYDIHLRSNKLNIEQYWNWTPLTISQKLNYMLHLHRPPVYIHSCQKTADTNKTWRKPKSASM